MATKRSAEEAFAAAEAVTKGAGQKAFASVEAAFAPPPKASCAPAELPASAPFPAAAAPPAKASIAHAGPPTASDGSRLPTAQEPQPPAGFGATPKASGTAAAQDGHVAAPVEATTPAEPPPAVFIGPPAVFTPNAMAFLDPKAYFKQWMGAGGPSALVPGQPVPAEPVAPVAPAPVVPTPAGQRPKTAIHIQVEEASAVKCATIVKDKGHNFTDEVACEAVHTMATKSSYKLREELLKQPAVKRLCQRVQNILQDFKKAEALPLEVISKAGWSLGRFPSEVLGEAGKTLGASVHRLKSMRNGSWPAEEASRVLYSLAKAEVIIPHADTVTDVVKEFVRDGGRKVNDLSYQGMVDLLWAVAQARQHNKEGDLRMARMQKSDEFLFQCCSRRLRQPGVLDAMPPDLLCTLANIHAEVGIKDVALFHAMCPRICKKQKDIGEKFMAKAIHAYRRFMIPLREEQQGFRTLAIVAKGDFVRPSDKPEKKGPKVYDKPQPLYPSTQIHSRG